MSDSKCDSPAIATGLANDIANRCDSIAETEREAVKNFYSPTIHTSSTSTREQRPDMDGQPAIIQGWPKVAGRCPACRGSSLFLGSGGHVTCSRLDCPNPVAVDDLLHSQPVPGGTR